MAQGGVTGRECQCWMTFVVLSLTSLPSTPLVDLPSCRPQAEVDAVVANTEAVRDAFRKLEGCMNRVSQIGTRIGDRLQASRQGVSCWQQ